MSLKEFLNRSIGKFIWKSYGPNLFLKIYQQISNSKAYELYCEALYGERYCTFNMMSQKQREFFDKLLENKKDMIALELGYGAGGLSQKISEKEYCKKLVAIDYSGFLPLKMAEKINFFRRDLNKLRIEKEQFDVVYCVDSLYHLKNYKKKLDIIYQSLKRNGEFILFHSFSSKDERDSFLEMLRPYKVVITDFTDDDRSYWSDNELSLKKFKQNFLDEGLFNIYNIRLKEIEKFKDLHENNSLFRFCFQIRR